MASAKSKLGCAAGCGLTVSLCSCRSWWDRARNGLGSVSDRPRIVNDVQLFPGNFCQILGGHFAWQAQYLVTLEGDTSCPAHCQ